MPELEAVFRLHGGRLKSVAYNLLGNESDAEDAVQEAFLKAHGARGTFSGRASLPTWVYRVLVNACLDEGRRRRRRPQGASVDSSPAVAAADSPADMRIALRQALEQIEERQRAVFLLAAVEGLAHGEIAEILEISETNSRTLLFEARKSLQARLARR